MASRKNQAVEAEPPTKRANLSFEQQWYRNIVFAEPLWIEKAEALTEAAAKLERSIAKGWGEDAKSRRAVHTLLPVYLMLTAYAAENILKATLITKAREQLAASRARTLKLPEWLRSHDLVDLARAASSSTVESRHTEELLRRMSRSAIWYGRYPVPLSSEGLKPQKSTAGELQFLNHLKFARRGGDQTDRAITAARICRGSTGVIRAKWRLTRMERVFGG